MMTIGENRVRLSFNPSANSAVDDIKRRSADCIDWCQNLEIEKPSAEIARCLALAQTHFETAAMWAVKAATANGSAK